MLAARRALWRLRTTVCNLIEGVINSNVREKHVGQTCPRKACLADTSLVTLSRHTTGELVHVRMFVLAATLLTLAGCGTSSASSPTPTPTVTAAPLIGQRFTSAPKMTINRNHHYTAAIVTTDGTFTLQLFPKLAPVTINNFVFLARHHYYDNNPFERVLRDFLIQTGDPTGTRLGGPGYEFQDEIHKGTRYTPGTVAMANLGSRNTNGSQFFIVSGWDGLALRPYYTIFGRVIKGMNVVKKIADTPVTTDVGTGEPSQPLVKVTMLRVHIYETR